MEELPKKYRDALSLIQAGGLTLKEVAVQSKLSEDTLYSLVEGKDAHKSKSGRLFFEEYKKIDRDRDREIRQLLKSNKQITHKLIHKWLEDKKNRKNVDKSLMSTIVSVANVLAKSTPNVEIGSFTYQKGLSAEDIYGEFKRLTGLALDRGSISGSPKGRTGEIPLAAGSGTPATEEPEDPVLRAEPEA